MRGVGGDVIGCEEAAFLDLGLFYEVIVPLMEMYGTATIFISTLVDRNNFFSLLLGLKLKSGESAFESVQITLVCDACRDAGILSECVHNASLKPDFKEEGGERMKRLYSLQGTNDAMEKLRARETLGIILEDSDSIFGRHVTAFENRPLVKHPHRVVTTVYVGIDPNGGSGSSANGSETAIVSFYLDGLNCVVRPVGGAARTRASPR